MRGGGVLLRVFYSNWKLIFCSAIILIPVRSKEAVLLHVKCICICKKVNSFYKIAFFILTVRINTFFLNVGSECLMLKKEQIISKSCRYQRWFEYIFPEKKTHLLIFCGDNLIWIEFSLKYLKQVKCSKLNKCSENAPKISLFYYLWPYFIWWNYFLKNREMQQIKQRLDDILFKISGVFLFFASK